MEEVCRHPEVDFVDVCTLPDVRLEPVRLCAQARKHVQVQKPIAVSPAIAREMIDTAAAAGILLHVVSQHRFDDSSLFLASAIKAGRLGRLLQCDAYVKWFRNDAYYARPGKGTWSVEGGGALMNQGIHQVDLLEWLAGPVREVSAMWQLGAAHAIESEDVVSAILRYAGGATGVIQAATAFQPGYPERMEFHGTKGSAIVTGDRLTAWDVRDDEGPPAPVSIAVHRGRPIRWRSRSSRSSGSSAISARPSRQQRQPLVSGQAGLQAVAVVDAIYRSCRSGRENRAMSHLAPGAITDDFRATSTWRWTRWRRSV